MQDWFKKINERPENERNHIALGLSVFLTLVVFFGWSVGKQSNVIAKKPTPSVQTASVAQNTSVWDTTISSIRPMIEQLKETFYSARESVENVLVPFVTGIEVYEKE